MERLVRRKFHSLFRAADMLTLNFGRTLWTEVRDGKTRQLSEFSLHVQAPWRFTENGTILLASGDAENAVPESFTARMENAAVVSVEEQENGDLRIEFSNGILFALTVDSPEKREYWRMMDFRTGENKVVFDVWPD